MSNNLTYLKEKISTILPKNNQFTIELKLQIILKLQKDETYTMKVEDLNEICRYCCDTLEVLDKLKAGECFIKGLLYYEIAKTKVKIAEVNFLNSESVSIKYLNITSCNVFINFNGFYFSFLLENKRRSSFKFANRLFNFRKFNFGAKRLKTFNRAALYLTLY